MDDSRVFEFATQCAKAYCAKFKDPTQLDEAIQNSAIFLLENRKIWGRPDGFLRWQTILNLVRIYQKEHFLRRKERPSRREWGDDLLEIRDARLEFYLEEAEVSDLIRRAIVQGSLTPIGDAIELLARRLKTRREVAREYGVSTAKLDRRFARFKLELKKLIGIRGVVIVDEPDPEDFLECPLFRFMKNAA